MKNVIYIAFTLLLCFAAYKFGDKHGYEAGYHDGYTYDCQADILQLRNEVTSLKKATEFANQAAAKVKAENDSMYLADGRRRYELRADSIEKETGIRPVSYDSSVKVNRIKQREQIRYMRQMMREGKL